MGKRKPIRLGESIIVAFSGHGIRRNEERMHISRTEISELFKNGIYASVGSAERRDGKYRYEVVWDHIAQLTYLVVLYQVQNVWAVKTLFPVAAGKICFPGVHVLSVHIDMATELGKLWRNKKQAQDKNDAPAYQTQAPLSIKTYQLRLQIARKNDEGKLIVRSNMLGRVRVDEYKEKHKNLLSYLSTQAQLMTADLLVFPANCRVEIQLKENHTNEILESLVLQDALW